MIIQMFNLSFKITTYKYRFFFFFIFFQIVVDILHSILQHIDWFLLINKSQKLNTLTCYLCSQIANNDFVFNFLILELLKHEFIEKKAQIIEFKLEMDQNIIQFKSNLNNFLVTNFKTKNAQELFVPVVFSDENSKFSKVKESKKLLGGMQQEDEKRKSTKEIKALTRLFDGIEEEELKKQLQQTSGDVLTVIEGIVSMSIDET
ncbi:hypothetical protein RFI_20104, partial [Reticulomyxa filosa]